jgi:hypothetical protein
MYNFNERFLANGSKRIFTKKLSILNILTVYLNNALACFLMITGESSNSTRSLITKEALSYFPIFFSLGLNLLFP